MGRKNQILAAIAAVIAVVAVLYVADHYWIAPSLGNHGKQPKVAYAMAPDFSLKGLDTDDVSLAAYRGKVVLLNFWATWCGPCRDEIPGFVEMQRKYGPQGFQILGISMDDGPEPVASFYSQFRMNYPVAMGSAKLAALYGGIYGLPTSFLIGRDGRIYDEVPGEVDQARWEKEIEELLAQPAGSPDKGFQPEGESAQVNVETPAERNSQIPGVDLAGLSKQQVVQLRAALSSETCTCGCTMSLLDCRTTDSRCMTSRDVAKAELVRLKKSGSTI